MITRRKLLAGASGYLIGPAAPKRVAAIVTAYFHNSHADLIVGRLLQTETLNGRGRKPGIELASLYVDQFPANDKSRQLSSTYGFPISTTPQDAVTLGTGRLAVDAVLIIGEHGTYPASDKGQELYPRKRFFDEVVEVYKRSGRSVPVFVDKHLSHDRGEAKEMVETARRMGFALMAGSSVPGTWRKPPIEVRSGAKLEEIVAVSYHTLYGYGFHALEMVQCLAERRRGGETGVRRVRCLEDVAVWDAGRRGVFSRELLDTALGRLSRGAPDKLEEKVPNPTAFIVEYRGGLRATVLTLNPAVGEWTCAWREAGKPPQATLFWTQEARPFGHFSFQLQGIERMILTGKPAWPVERTLLTSGMMDYLLTSRQRGGETLDTPDLDLRYRPGKAWKNPPNPPPGRPLDGE